MTVVFPDGVSAEGNIKVLFVPALADPSDPTVAELTAAGVVDLTPYIKGAFDLGGEQATGDDRRLSSKQTFQSLGRINRALQPIQYVIDPQAADAAADNKAYDTLKSGVQGHIVARYGLDSAVAIAATQKVDVAPVECGFQKKDPIGGDDEFAKITVTQAFAITGPVLDDVAVAAA